MDCCLNYDFLEFGRDMEDLREVYWGCSLVGRSMEMVSNGSSGFSTRYKFGPYLDLIPRVENAMRGISGPSKFFRVRSSYPWYDTTRFASWRERDGSSVVKLDLTSAKGGEFFVKHVPPGSTIEVTPHVCRMMENHDCVVRHINDCSVRVVSTCDDLVCRGSFPVFDRMIDWKTGCNFYRCGHGSMHFLPIWFEMDGSSFNLLNPLNRVGHEVSDRFRPLSFRACGCGRTAADVEFVSHFRYKPTDVRGMPLDSALGSEVYAMLPRSFNAQVVEQGGEIHVLLDREGSDLSFVPGLESFFGRPVRVHEGRVSMIGLFKIPFAWRSEELKTIPAHYPIV